MPKAPSIRDLEIRLGLDKLRNNVNKNNNGNDNKTTTTIAIFYHHHHHHHQNYHQHLDLTVFFTIATNTTVISAIVANKKADHNQL